MILFNDAFWLVYKWRRVIYKKLVFLYSLTLFGFVLIDVFSQMSDSNGLMIFSKFDQFLKEVLKLPTAVFEGPSFGYTEHSVRTCFPQQVRTVL